MPKSKILIFGGIGILILTIAFLGAFLILKNSFYQPKKFPKQAINYELTSTPPPLSETPSSQNLTPTTSKFNDFEPCFGIDNSQTNPIAYHRILLARSKDGLHFTRINKLISDRASVPDIMIDKEGNVRAYFVLITCKEQGQDLDNIPVVAISADNGKNWIYKKLIVEAPNDASHCKSPGGSPAPVDPEVLLMPDGTYRLYATCPQNTPQGTPMTYVFFSTDGIYFRGAKHTYIPTDGIALDPVVIKFGQTWNLFNGNSNPATSQDGITFNPPEKGIFCPFKFKKGEKEKCYVIGDALTLENSLGYRIYLFGDTPTEGFKSILSSDGKNWIMEQKSNEYILTVTPQATEEYHKLMFPTVARLSDGTYLMAYETFIPGTPSKIIESLSSEKEKEGEQIFSPPQQSTPPLKKPVGKCGDGICDSIEQTTNTCPLDCLR